MFYIELKEAVVDNILGFLEKSGTKFGRITMFKAIGAPDI